VKNRRIRAEFGQGGRRRRQLGSWDRVERVRGGRLLVRGAGEPRRGRAARHMTLRSERGGRDVNAPARPQRQRRAGAPIG